jgi:phosphatidylglycerophosphate synthase
VSPYFTVVCLRLGLGPDQVTLARLALGALGVALLLLPLGVWSLVGVVALEIAYVLDFSDGQVARLTGRTSAAGSYLDWLSHFYIPVGIALALAVSLGWWQGTVAYPIVGIFAALELSAFGFSCKEHILVAMLRRAPGLGAEAAFHAALRDDARPADVAAASGPAAPEGRGGLPGRAHGRSLRSLVGEVLLHQESIHLVTLAVVADLLVPLGQPYAFRALVLLLWAALFFVHTPLVARRNHALIRALEANSPTLELPAPPPPGGTG